jgi:hypothetical protein
MEQLADTGVKKCDERFSQLNRWTHLMSQAFEAKALLHLAETTHVIREESSLEELLAHQALFRSVLLAYGRCFVQSGRGRSSVDSRKVFEGQEEARQTHERIMQLRHKSAAHNDKSGLNDAAINVEEFEEEFVVSQRYAFALPLHEYSRYRACIEVLEKYIVHQMGRNIASLEQTLNKKLRVARAA